MKEAFLLTIKWNRYHNWMSQSYTDMEWKNPIYIMLLIMYHDVEATQFKPKSVLDSEKWSSCLKTICINQGVNMLYVKTLLSFKRS